MTSVFLVIKPSKTNYIPYIKKIPHKEDTILLYMGCHSIPK